MIEDKEKKINQVIIKPAETTEIVDVNNELSTSKSGVVESLEKNQLIEAHGGLSNYLAQHLLKTAEEALAPDNKGELHIDYRTRMKAVENILKMTEKDFGNNGIHVNFFSSPKQLKH